MPLFPWPYCLGLYWRYISFKSAVAFNAVAVDHTVYAVYAVAVITMVFSASIAVATIAFDAVIISLRTMS